MYFRIGCAIAGSDGVYFKKMFALLQKLLAHKKKLTVVDVGPAFGQCILPLVHTMGVHNFELVVLVEPVAALRQTLQHTIIQNNLQDIVIVIPGIVGDTSSNINATKPCLNNIGTVIKLPTDNLAAPFLYNRSDHHTFPSRKAHEFDSSYNIDYCNVLAPVLPLHTFLQSVQHDTTVQKQFDVDVLIVWHNLHVGSHVECVGEDLFGAVRTNCTISSYNSDKYITGIGTTENKNIVVQEMNIFEDTKFSHIPAQQFSNAVSTLNTYIQDNSAIVQDYYKLFVGSAIHCQNFLEWFVIQNTDNNNNNTMFERQQSYGVAATFLEHHEQLHADTSTICAMAEVASLAIVSPQSSLDFIGDVWQHIWKNNFTKYGERFFVTLWTSALFSIIYNSCDIQEHTCITLT